MTNLSMNYSSESGFLRVINTFVLVKIKLVYNSISFIKCPVNLPVIDVLSSIDVIGLLYLS